MAHDEGRWGMAESSFAVPPTYPFTMFLRAIGEQGTLEFQFKGESYAKPTARSLMLYPANGRVQDLTPSSGSPYLDQMEHFVTSVQQDIVPLYGHAADARAVLAVALAAQRSLESGGRPIGLEPQSSGC
jgi:predicted dehydrogenase